MLQIPNWQPCFHGYCFCPGSINVSYSKIPAKKVMVEQRTDGSIHISYNNDYLTHKQIELRPKVKEVKTRSPKKSYIPPADHPWRSFSISKKHNKQKEVACLTK